MGMVGGTSFYIPLLPEAASTSKLPNSEFHASIVTSYRLVP